MSARQLKIESLKNQVFGLKKINAVQAVEVESRGRAVDAMSKAKKIDPSCWYNQVKLDDGQFQEREVSR